MLEDCAIVELYWQRSEEAICETARKYGAYCRTIIRNILGSSEDTEECENDTWLSAWNAMPTKRPDRLAPFLGRIARNHALDRYDYNTAKKRAAPAALLIDELADCLPGGQEVEEALDERELAALVTAFLRTQSETARGVFLRRYWYAEPIEAIAARYGLTQVNTRTLLSRTRARLRAYLEEEGVSA